MIYEFNRNIQDKINNLKTPNLDFLYHQAPKFLTSKTRMHKMFLNKCEMSVNDYSNCLNNSEWKENIDSYVTPSDRRRCYNQWSLVKQCSTRYLGDSFTMKLDLTRQLNTNLEQFKSTEQEELERYEEMMRNQIVFLQEESPVEGEEPAVEEEVEEEGEGEGGDEEEAD